jgi:hypothetical protein
MGSKKILYFFAIISFTVSSVNSRGQSKNTQRTKSIDSLELVSFAKKVLKIIKSTDYTTFSGFIDPKLGVRFSPYAYTNVKTDLKFSQKKFLSSANSKKRFLWGEVDPTGTQLN